MQNSWRILNHLTGATGDGTGLRQTGGLSLDVLNLHSFGGTWKNLEM